MQPTLPGGTSPMGGTSPTGGEPASGQEDLTAHGQSVKMSKNTQVQVQQKQVGNAPKTDEEAALEQTEQNNELERLRQGSIDKKSGEETVQKTTVKESRQQALNNTTPGQPKLDAYQTAKQGSLGNSDDAPYLVNNQRPVTLKSFDNVMQKMGIPPSENNIAAPEGSPLHAEQFAAKGFTEIPKGIGTYSEPQMADPARPALAAPQTTDQPAAPAASSGNAGASFYMGGNWKVELNRSQMDLENANRDNMLTNAYKTKAWMDAGIDQINNSYQDMIQAGKAEAAATRKQGTQAMVGGIISFSSSVVGAGLGAGIEKVQAGGKKTTGIGFKAGTEIGQQAGQAGRGISDMMYSKGIAAEQVVKSAADAAASVARSTEQLINNVVQTNAKANDNSSSVNDQMRQERAKISQEQAQRSSRLFG